MPYLQGKTAEIYFTSQDQKIVLSTSIQTSVHSYLSCAALKTNLTLHRSEGILTSKLFYSIFD